MTNPATIVDAPARPAVEPIEADEAPVTVVVEDDLSDALEPIDGPGQSAVVTLSPARIDALVSPPVAPASTPPESIVPLLSVVLAALSQIKVHIPAVMPLAEEVVAGKLTRDEFEAALPDVLDAVIDFSAVPVLGTTLEQLDGDAAKLLVHWIAHIAIHRAQVKAAPTATAHTSILASILHPHAPPPPVPAP